MNKIWLDIANTPQVHFLLAIKSMLPKAEFTLTARDFSETLQLLDKYDEKFIMIGNHKGKNRIKKAYGLIERFWTLKKKKLEYEVSISCGSESAVYKAFFEKKKIITFGDNDLAKQWTYGLLADYCFFPSAIDQSILTKQLIAQKKIVFYDGYKEDLYIAKYDPDKKFLENLPFDNYVIVRPENIKANYVKNGKNVITPYLLQLLSNRGYNILYLPRYDLDKDYAQGIKNIYIPETALNGLDAVYYSDAVLTGAGTFAREAACLGVPSVSFFAGHKLLSVDKSLIEQGKMFFSRNPKDIMERIPKMKRDFNASDRSLNVYDEVKSKLTNILYQNN